MANCIPTIDLSPFFTEGDQDGKNKAIELITEACSQYGFFQIVNHGVPPELLSRALELAKTLHGYSNEEKRKFIHGSDGHLPAGYFKIPEHTPDKNGYDLLFSPVTASSLNAYPQDPPDFKEVLEDIFSRLKKTSLLMESILNECLGLPPNFLKEYNNDRSSDFMVAAHYPPATENEHNGLIEHEDGNCFTFVFQNDAGGLEFKKNSEWIPATPAQDKLLFIIGDIIQVLSNKKFKSSTHRVVRPKEKDRFSYIFFYSLQEDKWVEPLPQFTKEIGKPPKYGGFLYKDYRTMKMKNKTRLSASN